MNSLHKQHRVIARYDSPYPQSLSFRQGEQVIVGKHYNGDEGWVGWVWCTGRRGQEAWVPEEYLESSGQTPCLARDYDARELSLVPGEIVTELERVGGFILAEDSRGIRGWAPLRNLTEIAQ